MVVVICGSMFGIVRFLWSTITNALPVAKVLGIMFFQLRNSKVHIQRVNALVTDSIDATPRMVNHLNPYAIEVRDEDLVAYVVRELSGRELAVFDLVGQGYNLKFICVQLGIAYKTAATHRQHIMAKLNLTGDAQLGVMYWRIQRLLTDELRKS